MSPIHWLTPSVIAIALACLAGAATEPPAPADSADRPLKVPAGFVVERVAGPPLVNHPMNGCFDEQGRLFLTEAAGLNLKADDLLRQLPNSIKRLEDSHGDGRFDKAVVFADKMTFPQGALWHDGALFTTAYPSLWRLDDADRRTAIAGKFGSTGNAADLHGPQLGPDGMVYFCDGRNGHDIQQPDGFALKGRAAAVYRCRPDGSHMERVCGGGMDNPVEVAFTPAGEPLVVANIVLNAPRHDAILFALEGAVYPYYESMYPEFRMTGEPMPITGDLGWVAVSSFIRYRGDAFGPGYRDTFFTAQFNPHRIQRHIIERDGAGFRVRTEDFVTCDDPDFHPTGLVEDADGSLLVIDTGAWFRIGCPTSQVAKPNILGGVYRIRKKDTQKTEDPHGLRLAWDKMDSTDLIRLLDDPRFAVRDRAVAALAREGAGAVGALTKRLEDAKAPHESRLNALWALTRIDAAEARAAVRPALSDADLDVRLAAIYSAGLNRDIGAYAPLIKAVSGGVDPAVRRAAATALGQLGEKGAIPELLEGLGSAGDDRWLEHALIYALICLDDPQATRHGLADHRAAVQRGALIALDQTADGALASEDVVPVLSSSSPATVNAALRVLKAHPAWVKETLGLLRKGLEQGDEEAAHRETLRGLLTAFTVEPEVQDLIGQALRRDKTPPALQLLLMEVIAEAPVDRMPSTWTAELRWRLDSDDSRIVRQAVECLRAGKTVEFAPVLLKLAADANGPKDLRVNALAAAVPQLKQLDAGSFGFLCDCLGDDQPLLRLAAADVLGQAPLNTAQLQTLAEKAAMAGPLEMGRLVTAFASSSDARVGKALVQALGRSPGLASLSPGALRAAVRNYPADIRAGAEALLQRNGGEAEANKHLTELKGVLEGGDADKGRVVFFSGRTVCSACHTVNGQGGRVGPELSKIGGIRAPADLLESVLYPSATIVRGYEAYNVQTKEGRQFVGLLARETADAVYLKTAERMEIRVPRAAVESMEQSRLSIMPQGLEARMNRDELRDLIAFLRSLK
jgi:putative membrane-bound dehydrogenase-like protein